MKNKNLLKYIQCPRCGGTLYEKNQNLKCDSCKDDYPIKNEIPILVSSGSVTHHHWKQIDYFANETHKNLNLTHKISEWQRRYLKKFQLNIKPPVNSLVVDCGTGSGYMAIEIAKKGINVIACDLSYESLLLLKQKISKLSLSDRIFVVCCSAEELPFKSNIADTFISNAVLEHLPNEIKAISEINRVCKEKSNIMITVPIEYYYLCPVFLIPNFIHDLKIGHLRRYSINEINKKFQEWKTANVYYNGNFSKALLVGINMFFPKLINESIIEKYDKDSQSPWWKNNMIAFLKRSIK